MSEKALCRRQGLEYICIFSGIMKITYLSMKICMQSIKVSVLLQPSTQGNIHDSSLDVSLEHRIFKLEEGL
jgi:hypothetical protein